MRTETIPAHRIENFLKLAETSQDTGTLVQAVITWGLEIKKLEREGKENPKLHQLKKLCDAIQIRLGEIELQKQTKTENG